MTLTTSVPTDAARFDTLVRAHAGAISAYLRCRAYPLSPSDVDDLLAETLIVVWRRLGSVPSDAELPWMLGVARRVLANAKRSEQRRLPRESVPAPLFQPTTEDTALANEALDRALTALSYDERDILLASVWDGLSNESLAVVYDTTRNAAATRLSRAREKFVQAYTN